MRPAKSSHCDVCNNCVENWDHHCLMLNNCIGKRNIRYFIYFIAATVTSSMYNLIISVVSVIYTINRYRGLYYLISELQYEENTATPPEEDLE